jgi:putative membrane protein
MMMGGMGLLLLVVLIWALVRWLNERTSGTPPNQMRSRGGSSAQEIIEQRYARGEIDAATFERMREQLSA